ncbi:MAG: alpha-galactosidase, partial [Muribaculaceae bacterium]|nr:alpha-galactosidase [Muribaculaceae bacterium]
MKHHISCILVAAAVAASSPCISAEIINLSTPGTSLVLNANEGSPLQILYYGEKLHEKDLENLRTSPVMRHDAYPVYGIYPQGEAAMSVTHADGNRTTAVEVTGVRTTEENGANVTTVAMRDRVYSFELNVNYRVRPGYDVIETWVEVTNNEKGTVTLNRFMSGYLPIHYGDVWISSLYGSWANETELAEEPLRHGVRMIKNKDGLRNSHTAHGEVMFSLDGRPQENSGRVIGAALCYPGNYKLFVDTDDSNYHHFFAGINEENSEYHLRKGETFTTPELALTYSGEGLSGASRNFHKWGRDNRLHAGDKERKILLNSWEGVYF